MLSKRIKKYQILSRALLNEKKELEKIAEGDITNSIVSAFAYCKNNKSEDRKVFDEMEKYRTSLLQNKSTVTFEIFNSPKKSDISTICKKAASPKQWCHLFYYLCKIIKAKNVLELGTNLGVSGQYFLAALSDNEEATFITMEAHPQYCHIARERFKEVVPAVNTQVIEGFYENTLDEVLTNTRKFDLVFIDGHHKKDATLMYFDKIKPHLRHGAIVIFDDINWSNEMQDLWEIIKTDVSVLLTVDFYKLGIVIYSSNSQKLDKTTHANLFLSF